MAMVMASSKRRNAADEQDDGATPRPKRRKTGDEHGGGRSPGALTKRRGGRSTNERTSAASAAPNGIEGAGPAWISSALGMLRAEALGAPWDEIVRLWEAFEVQNGAANVGRIGATRRPTCVADWIQRARAPAYRPSITNFKKFSSDFFAWWAAIQPDWRRDGDSALLRQSGDMSDISRSGVNGLLSVLAALFFWGTALGENREVDGDWKAAVEDVDWVLRELLREEIPTP